jgi:Tol biopolymer transport system component
MGEVYRAKDPRLGRDVAIKVLPASLSQDADRLKRFEQEARAAGVLNHPNITAVYDLGTHDGAPYIVTELLEGETLRSRLSGGALSVRKATDYAIQIAKGLAAAHEKGIVHRDLKPENLFVTKDGRVKILDFGLAKLKSEKDGEQQTDLRTVSGTEPGVVLGTMGYMSPEQVRGKAADRRSDLFSFGTILYEMLSGHRAFRGDTAADTITAILSKEPPDLSTSNQDIHPGLERIVRHCLEKNPEERFESARDLAFDLESLSNLSAPAGAVTAPFAAAKRRRVWPLVAGAVLGTALAVGVPAYLAGRRAGEQPPPSFRQLTFRRGEILSAHFAPDGTTVVYSAAWDGKPVEIFVGRLESPESRPFGLPGAEVLAISRLGEAAVSLNRHSAGGFRRSGTLARISIAGGAPRDVLEDVDWADWAPNGNDLAVVRSDHGEIRLEYPIGKVLWKTSGWIGNPRVSPAGDRVAFVDHPVGTDDGGSVAVVDRAGRKTALSKPFSSVQGLAWRPDGAEVWFTAAEVSLRALYSASLSGDVRLRSRVAGNLTLRDISAAGRLLVTKDTFREEMRGLAPGESKERDLTWLDYSLPTAISVDGRTVLFTEGGEGGGPGYSVYVRATDGSPAVRLGEGFGQALSPDKKWAIAIQRPATDPQLVAYPTGAGEARVFPREGLSVLNACWFPDGKKLLFTANEPGRGPRLYERDFAGGKPRALTPEGYRGLRVVSPDGKWAVVTGPDRKTYLYPLAGGEPTVVSGVEVNEVVAGAASDSRSIYVYRRGEIPTNVSRLDVTTGQRQPWRSLAPADTGGVSDPSPLTAPSGDSYIYNYNRTLSDLYLVEGLK